MTLYFFSGAQTFLSVFFGSSSCFFPCVLPSVLSLCRPPVFSLSSPASTSHRKPKQALTPALSHLRRERERSLARLSHGASSARQTLTRLPGRRSPTAAPPRSA